MKKCPYCKKELTLDAEGLHCYPCKRLFRDCKDCKHYFDNIRWCSIFDKEVFYLSENNNCDKWEGRKTLELSYEHI